MWNFDVATLRQNYARDGGRGSGERGGRDAGGQGGWGRGGDGHGQPTEGNTQMEMEYSTQDVRPLTKTNNRGPRKRLVDQDGIVNTQEQPAVLIKLGTVAGKVLLIEGAPPATMDDKEAMTPGKVPIVKRRRQGEEGESVDDTMSEATSLEDRRPRDGS